VTITSDESGSAGSSAGGVKPTILVVEDEHIIREMITECLEREGYTVLSTDSATKAIELWSSRVPSIPLLVADSGLKGLRGVLLASLLIEEKPDLKVLFATGEPSDLALVMLKENRNSHLLKKPYSAKELSEAVRAILLTRPDGETK
jgi:DNA-binding response OmpR family regulator